MVSRELQNSWRITQQYLEQAITYFPSAASPKCEDGSLASCRDYIQHNELGLAFDELSALGKANSVPQAYWRSLLAAAENMKIAQGIEDCQQALSKYPA